MAIERIGTELGWEIRYKPLYRPNGKPFDSEAVAAVMRTGVAEAYQTLGFEFDQPLSQEEMMGVWRQAWVLAKEGLVRLGE